MANTEKPKYKEGNAFLTDTGDIITIKGYNYMSLRGVTYSGEIIFESVRGKEVPMETNHIYEERLDKAKFFESIEDLRAYINADGIFYKIHYADEGEIATNITIRLSGINELAKVLNGMKKKNPKRRIIIVLIVDAKGKYLGQTKFLKQEMEKQRWLTGKKERLLASAKYEHGYEVLTNF